MSHVPQPDADRGTEAAPLGDGHPHPVRRRAARRAALTAAAVAGLAVTALPWLPLAALSAATSAHPASTSHRPAAGRSDRRQTGSPTDGQRRPSVPGPALVPVMSAVPAASPAGQNPPR